MSMYNMIHGMNASLAVLASPFLPMPADSFPRFRDIFLESDNIHVYTRMGAGNAECWESGEEECDCVGCRAAKIELHPDCIETHEDEFDCTYKTFVFRVPDKWKSDFKKIEVGNLKDTSQEYKDTLLDIFKDRVAILNVIDKWEKQS